MTELQIIFTLLILFQIKHFVCDYPLQTPYMLGKFKESDWKLPLLAHTGTHASATFVIVMLFTASVTIAVLAAIFDLLVHSVMDRVKASPKMLGRYDIKDKRFWWSLGFDQLIHHVTHYLIILGVVLS